MNAAQPVSFEVTIQFADGVYKRVARAASAQRAINLAIVDARMASPFSQFFGKVLSSAAVEMAAA